MTVTSAQPSRSAVRTYGGWRKARGIGLFGIGPVGTVVVLGCIVVPMLLASVRLSIGAAALPAATLVAALTIARFDDMTLAQVVGRRLRWAWAVRRGWTTYRADTLVERPDAWDLPGVLASTRLLSAANGRGGTFGLVWNRRTGHMTATLRCAAMSTWLVDSHDADGWVANWHSWLASLGYLPMVRNVAVTVDTAPEPGTALQDAVLPQIAPDAPHDVRRLMLELVARSPAASADVDTRVSVTFDPAAVAPRLRDLDDAVEEISRQLAGLESSLGTCGVTVLGRASAEEIAGIVRTAFDPSARGDVQRALAAHGPDGEGLDWTDAGPVAADEYWDHYRHDSGVSVTWGWREAPRQHVTSGVLTRLLSPGRFAKRVTLVFRPLPAGEAARVLEAQVNAAAFRDAYRRAQRRDESARDVADRLQAQRAAAEEAQGAGLVVIALYVTATARLEADLPSVVADVEARAEQSKIQLRRLVGSQSSAFATTLPCGVTSI
jgi:hypothetical protein